MSIVFSSDSLCAFSLSECFSQEQKWLKEETQLGEMKKTEVAHSIKCF